MMERLCLGVLYFSGCFIIATCLQHYYYFVPDPMNWEEAQAYCREAYTDLATMENTEEMNQFLSTVRSTAAASVHAVWIGLYSVIHWRWSDGNGVGFTNWDLENGQPNFRAGDQFCVTIYSSATWDVYNCSDLFTFICYHEIPQGRSFFPVGESMNWSDAQTYCRKKYTDLATISTNSQNLHAFFTLMPKPEKAWIGLFRNPDIHWSDGSDYSFKNWEDVDNPLSFASKICGAAALRSSGQWRVLPCEEKLPFVCYSTALYPAPVKRQIFKLSMKLDSSVDPNDPAVKADLLKQNACLVPIKHPNRFLSIMERLVWTGHKLQDKLKEKGISGVTLKWREQPDGKVFHKDRKGSQEKKTMKCEL